MFSSVYLDNLTSKQTFCCAHNNNLLRGYILLYRCCWRNNALNNNDFKEFEYGKISIVLERIKLFLESFRGLSTLLWMNIYRYVMPIWVAVHQCQCHLLPWPIQQNGGKRFFAGQRCISTFGRGHGPLIVLVRGPMSARSRTCVRRSLRQVRWQASG